MIASGAFVFREAPETVWNGARMAFLSLEVQKVAVVALFAVVVRIGFGLIAISTIGRAFYAVNSFLVVI